MDKISKQALNSMNYFFLREVFQKNEVSKRMSEEIENSRALGEKSDNIYKRLILEIEAFLRLISKEELSADMIEIFSSELEEGDYMADLSFDEVKEMFANAIKEILGYQDEVLLSKYINIANTVYDRL